MRGTLFMYLRDGALTEKRILNVLTALGCLRGEGKDCVFFVAGLGSKFLAEFARRQFLHLAYAPKCP